MERDRNSTNRLPVNDTGHQGVTAGFWAGATGADGRAGVGTTFFGAGVGVGDGTTAAKWTGVQAAVVGCCGAACAARVTVG